MSGEGPKGEALPPELGLDEPRARPRAGQAGGTRVPAEKPSSESRRPASFQEFTTCHKSLPTNAVTT